MGSLLAVFVAKQFDLNESDKYLPILRFFFWSFVILITFVVCLFIVEIYVHYLKYGWIKEIYNLLQIIKVREARTIETHEKVDKTLQKMEESVKPIVDTIKPLIESNPAIAIVPPEIKVEVKRNDTKASDNR